MLEPAFVMLCLVILAALLFDYINGFHDTANAIATCISTRALSVKSAIMMAALLNFAGAMISTKVATTIGKGIVDSSNVTQMVVLAGITGAIVWDLITWYYGLPSSSSHAIIGGIIGAVFAHAGMGALKWAGLNKIIMALILSPILGTAVGFIFMMILYRVFRNSAPSSLNKNFRRLQIVSAALMAFSHGTADAQKSMGVITLALVSYGFLKTFAVPWEVMVACAAAMALGTAAGGWRIIKTVGRDFVKLQPVHGFCVETASAGVILGASALGMPTST
ncbi:MAG: inorganic phosphate transporter, partial [Deltaproteobacteria bacterium]